MACVESCPHLGDNLGITVENRELSWGLGVGEAS
jgi:hypothetical protein